MRKKIYNEKLRTNGAALVLTAMCRGPKEELRRLASKALGAMGWNGYVDQRVLRWDVKQHWDEYQKKTVENEEEKLKRLKRSFNDKWVAEKDVDEEIDRDEFKPSPHHSVGEVVRLRKQWALRRAKRKESPNLENQKHLGEDELTLTTIEKLSKENNWGDCKKCMSSNTLAMAAYDSGNAKKIGTLERVVSAILKLSQSWDQEVSAQAAGCLANLAYNSNVNQEMIGKLGGAQSIVWIYVTVKIMIFLRQQQQPLSI